MVKCELLNVLRTYYLLEMLEIDVFLSSLLLSLLLLSIEWNLVFSVKPYDSIAMEKILILQFLIF